VKNNKIALKDYLSKTQYTAGGVVSLLRVLRHALNDGPTDQNLICGCSDLVEKIMEEAQKVNLALDSASIPKGSIGGES
jgi:hypothetical protein